MNDKTEYIIGINDDSINDCNNIYRARELLLLKGPEILTIIKESKGMSEEKREKLFKDKANEIVEEQKYPYFWRKVLYEMFMSGKLKVFKEDLTTGIDLGRNEVFLRVNSSTTKKDYVSAWSEILKLQNRLRATHKPRKISFRDFIFTFADVYKTRSVKISALIKDFWKKKAEYESKIGFDEKDIRVGIAKTKKMLGL